MCKASRSSKNSIFDLFYEKNMIKCHLKANRGVMEDEKSHIQLNKMEFYHQTHVIYLRKKQYKYFNFISKYLL